MLAPYHVWTIFMISITYDPGNIYIDEVYSTTINSEAPSYVFDIELRQCDRLAEKAQEELDVDVRCVHNKDILK